MDDRYARQLRFAPIGAPGQLRLAAARVLVCGCGALGAAAAEMLARAGVGSLTLLDRDFVEASNLQRQALYAEDDALAVRPKAQAAARRLAQINADIQVVPQVGELRAATAIALVQGHDLVIDGLDSFAARHVLNDACCQLGIPWIHGACVGAYALSLVVLPGDGPCLRCLQDRLPDPGDAPTCDSAGIIGPAVQQVAAWQVAEALKLLIGDRAAVCRDLRAADLWRGTTQRLALAGARDAACRSCGAAADRPALLAVDDAATVLCGRDAVQVRLGRPVDIAALAARLPAVLAANDFLVRWPDDQRTLTCFRDGRVLVQGVADGAAARSAVDRWLG